LATPQKNSLPVFEAPSLKQYTSVRHGFFTRQGGVSQNIYQSLNIGLGSNDNPDHITQNRALIAAHFGVDPAYLLSPHQYHSANVVPVLAPFTDVRPKADALVSNVPNLILSIATADCAPVLFADPVEGVIGAAHAGWRGAYHGILENTVSAMEKLGSRRKNIIASIGPCIGAQNYQVGFEFFTRFISQSSDNRRYFVASSQKNHYFFDLGRYNVQRLAQMGVDCENLNLCTYTNATHFYSYRRMTHAQEADYGRQMSAIMMEG